MKNQCNIINCLVVIYSVYYLLASISQLLFLKNAKYLKFEYLFDNINFDNINFDNINFEKIIQYNKILNLINISHDNILNISSILINANKYNIYYNYIPRHKNSKVNFLFSICAFYFFLDLVKNLLLRRLYVNFELLKQTSLLRFSEEMDVFIFLFYMIFLYLLIKNLLFRKKIILKFKYLIYTFFAIVLNIFLSKFHYSLEIPYNNKNLKLVNPLLNWKINKLSKELGFPTDSVFVHKVSDYSKFCNAYFFEFRTTKIIVLYDILLKIMKDNEILGVLCHEIGHYKHNHILLTDLLNLAYFIFLMLVILYVYKNTNEILNNTDNYGNKKNFIFIINILLVYLYTNKIFNLLFNIISQSFEFQADRFAVESGFGKEIITALVKLNFNNFDLPSNTPLFSLFFKHPFLENRLNHIKSIMKNPTT